MSPDEYRAQNRGGRGKTGMKVHEDDVVKQVLYTSSHDFLLFFTNLGRVFKMKTYRVPQCSRISKGTPIVNLLKLPDGEFLTAMASISDFEKEGYILFISKYGVVKRTPINEFQNIRTTGIRALSLRENDMLHNVFLTDGTKDVIIGASNGKAIRFSENDVRSMGRNAAGVRGIELEDNEEVVGAAIASNEDEQVLVVTVKGYGKRTYVSEYRKQSRGGKGVKTLQITEKNGVLSRLVAVTGDEDLFVITDRGMTIRTHVDQISILSRATQGVRIINLLEDQKVMTMTLLPKDEELDEEEEKEEITVSLDTKKEEPAPIKEDGDKSDEVF